MAPTNRVVEIETRSSINSILFTKDGKQVLGGGDEGLLRRWQANDGHEDGNPIRVGDVKVFATALSQDGEWLVCGLNGRVHARLFNANISGMVLDVAGHRDAVYSVDISPDGTKFATGSRDKQVFIWRLPPSSAKLLGPLRHDSPVVAVRFSPNGERIATATQHASIRVYNSINGQQLLHIPFEFHLLPSSPITWSSDGRQLFAISHGKAKGFDTSTRLLVSQWSVPSQTTASIVLSRDARFAAVVTDRSLSFWDVSGGNQIGNIIEHASIIRSVALSPDDDCIATGEENGKVTFRSLYSVLPHSYLPVTLQLRVRLEIIIDRVIEISPLVLIDVESGRLCDGRTRAATLKSEPGFNKLLSFMTDEEHIQSEVEKYFQYVMLSHVWEGDDEPSFQDAEKAGTICNLKSPRPFTEKLQRFCEAVRADGYRWAWSDTCCIDKTNSDVLTQTIKKMYLWYESSAATFVYLGDVESPSDSIKGSKWLTRAWTAQELLSPKVVRFYTRDWKPYLGDRRPNHKESPEIMEELAGAIGIPRSKIISFSRDDLSVREKLRLAATRHATIEEDIAYSLMGIFKSDITPHYGEGQAALGHLLEEIVTRSGDMTVLDWTGKSSSHNSCLPASLVAYSQPPAFPTIKDGETQKCVSSLRVQALSSPEAAHKICEQVTSLGAPGFANRQLHLPCITFAVRRLGVADSMLGLEYRYRARVEGIGNVDFQTSEALSRDEPEKFIFIYPWIRYPCHLSDDDKSMAVSASKPHPSLHAKPTCNNAWLVVVRLQQQFPVLLLKLQERSERVFRRVATEHEILAPGFLHGINLAENVHVELVQIE